MKNQKVFASSREGFGFFGDRIQAEPLPARTRAPDTGCLLSEDREVGGGVEASPREPDSTPQAQIHNPTRTILPHPGPVTALQPECAFHLS